MPYVYSPKDNLPAPQLGDIANGPAHLTALRDAVDGKLAYYCTESPDTRPTGTARYTGRLIYCTDTKAYGWWDGSVWRMFDTQIRTYTTTWTCTVANGALGTGGAIISRYQRRGGLCLVDIELTVGSSGFSGGAGAWQFTAPMNMAGGGQQHLSCKAWAPNAGGSGNYVGFAYLDSGAALIRPFLPQSSTVHTPAQAMNADASGAVGTGVPVAAGQYTWTNQGNLHIWGEYPI